jgi:hypothetical protein
MRTRGCDTSRGVYRDGGPEAPGFSPSRSPRAPRPRGGAGRWCRSGGC